MSSSAQRSLQRMSGPAFGGMGQFGGAFLLINALSGKIYELIAEATQVVTHGYETGGLLGLARSQELRRLLRRYLWLLSLVFVYERIRWLWSFFNGFKSLMRYLWIDATLRTSDQAYEWMLAYWEHSSGFRKKSRDFVVETGLISNRKRAQQAILHGYSFGNESIYMDSQDQKESEMQTRITPKDEADEWFIDCGAIFWMRRRQQSTAPNYMAGVDAYTTPIITIRCFALTRKPLFKLLRKAKEVFDRTRPPMITIRVLDMRGTWRKVAYKARRPLSSIIMDDEKRQALLNDAREFLKSEDWYAARGLRWNRGYLLHGAPGTGKSSTIQALASEIKLDIYIISINSPSMNDSVLMSAMRSIPPKSIVCMEDVDAVFSTQKRELKEAPPRQKPSMRMSGFGELRYPMGGGEGGNISLSAALNAIDGVESNEGRLLIMSTNLELSELDAALTRPGRCDMYIHYKRATRAQAEELFNIFYKPTQVEEPDIVDIEGNGDESVSGTPVSGETEAVIPAVLKKLSPIDKIAAKKTASNKKSDSHHPFDLPPEATQAKISEWARAWAAHIEDEQFTIAELQGMLLLYKKDPEEAMREMPAWVEKELARRKADAEKEKKRQEEQQEQKKKEEETEVKEKMKEKADTPLAFQSTADSATQTGIAALLQQAAATSGDSKLSKSEDSLVNVEASKL